MSADHEHWVRDDADIDNADVDQEDLSQSMPGNRANVDFRRDGLTPAPRARQN
jgi:hypothetical protein